MVLPLYLAMTAQEMAGASSLPRHLGLYSPAGQAGAMLILDDRDPECRHDPMRVKALDCESVLLDFERGPDADSVAAAKALFRALSCPVAAPPGFGEDRDCAVFLPPCPLHVPLAEYLRPWQDREVWLDVTMQQQTLTVTRDGTQYGPATPSDRQTDGWFDEILQCQCLMEISEEEARFTLFDTPETLKLKLDQATKLGVARAVGLYQELYGKIQFGEY